MQYKLTYEGVSLIVDPDRDTVIFRTPRNPSFLVDKQLAGSDLFVCKYREYQFFYAVHWDLLQEQKQQFFILTQEQAQKELDKAMRQDYLGFFMNDQVKKRISEYGLTHSA